MKKKIAIITAVIALVLLLPLTVFAEGSAELLTDNAGLLSDSEKETVLESLHSVSSKYDVDIAVLTTESTDGEDVTTYSDQYYLDHGYGRGADRSGTLLVISAAERDWHISTHGEGIKAFTEYGIRQLGEEIGPYLSSGDYATAFRKYAEIADQYFSSERSGNPVDAPKRSTSSYIIQAVVAVVLGFLFSFAVTGAMKKKMKSVRRQASATAYATEEGIRLTESTDRFLYHRVVAVPLPRNNSSGGSSTHSTGGSTFGGGGGKF